MIKQFFFGPTDSPLFMFHHALGAMLILIFSCFFIAIILNWISVRRKTKSIISIEKIIPKKTGEVVSEKIQEEKKAEPIAVPTENQKTESSISLLTISSPEPIVHEIKQPTPDEKFIITEYKASVCNLNDHLFQFIEILLNKKLTEQDWDKRIPENALLDHRNYHRLIYLLINLNPEIEQTTSRFKLVLETKSEVAINHQIYFRNWMLPSDMISTFKTGNNFSPEKKEISMAVKIAEQKNWKLQASSSEQGTMINLLMKLSISE